MADIQIARYYTDWDVDGHVGRIALYDAANNLLDNRLYASADEFQVVVSMLRYEKPLTFENTLRLVRTGFAAAGEPTGEEET